MSATSIAAVLLIPEKRAAYWLSLIEAWQKMDALAASIAAKSDDVYQYEMCQQLERHRKAFLDSWTEQNFQKSTPPGRLDR